jgi:hypothetical protein
MREAHAPKSAAWRSLALSTLAALQRPRLATGHEPGYSALIAEHLGPRAQVRDTRAKVLGPRHLRWRNDFLGGQAEIMPPGHGGGLRGRRRLLKFDG